MRTNKTLRQKVQICGLSGKGKNITKMDTLTNALRARGEGTITRTPGQNKFMIKRGKRIRNKEKRKRKDHLVRESKSNRKPMNQKRRSRRRRDDKTADPLDTQGTDLGLTIDNRKTTQKIGLVDYLTLDKITLAISKKLKN